MIHNEIQIQIQIQIQKPDEQKINSSIMTGIIQIIIQRRRCRVNNFKIVWGKVHHHS